MLHIFTLSGAQDNFLHLLIELQHFNILVVLVRLVFFSDPASLDFLPVRGLANPF